MLTSLQEIAIALILAAIWLAVGSLMVMQWRVRNLLDWTFKLRLSPPETKEVIRMHRTMFPNSKNRKLVGYGSALLAISAGVLALISSRHT
jgi:hypothetical protein